MYQQPYGNAAPRGTTRLPQLQRTNSTDRAQPYNMTLGGTRQNFGGGNFGATFNSNVLAPKQYPRSVQNNRQIDHVDALFRSPGQVSLYASQVRGNQRSSPQQPASMNMPRQVSAPSTQQIEQIPAPVTNNAGNFPAPKLYFGQASIIGRRATQEDAEVINENGQYQIVGVFDGHGGDEASHFCQQHFTPVLLDELSKANNDVRSALFNTCLRIDATFVRTGSYTVGCTLTSFVLDKQKNSVVVANVGDSKTIVGATNQAGQAVIYQTNDHKPSSRDEQYRIKKYFPNTRIVNIMGISRVDGQLSLSRAIGDSYMKQSGIIPEPDLYEINGANINYVVLACDGLFDVVTVNELDDLMRSMIAGQQRATHGTRPQLIAAAISYFTGNNTEGDKLLSSLVGQKIYRSAVCCEVDPNAPPGTRAAQILARIAFWRGSMDNVTVVCGIPQ